MNNININELIYYISNNVKAWNIILDCFKATQIDQYNENFIQRGCEEIAQCI